MSESAFTDYPLSDQIRMMEAELEHRRMTNPVLIGFGLMSREAATREEGILQAVLTTLRRRRGDA